MPDVQLEWDGVVLPVPETTWATVLATAERFQGLELHSDFFVTYKDEEADVINVRSEVDFAEALQWALEQNVPCLCLHVPFSSDESDTDESWTEVETGAPRDVNQDVPASYVEDTDQQQPIVETRYEEVVEDEESLAENPGSEAVAGITQAVVEQQPVFEPVSLTVISAALDEIAPVLNPLRETQTVSPILEVIEELSSGIDGLTISNEEVASTNVSDLTLERLIELLCALNHAQAGLDRDFVLNTIGDKTAFKAIITFFSHPVVAEAVRAVVESEKSNPGTLHKAATTQLIKAISLSPESLALLNCIPGASELIQRSMHTLRATPFENEASSGPRSSNIHANVECDGCRSDAVLANSSLQGGYRNAEGVIVGIRYKSVTLPDYDLCEACESSGRFDIEAGPFLKVRSPDQAPELILCVMPGATNGMMSQLEAMDWRNPLVREFSQFVQARQSRSTGSSTAAPVATSRPPAPQPPPRAVDVSAAQQAVAAARPQAEQQQQPPVAQSDLRCSHELQRFDAASKNYRCDMCNRAQVLNATLFGCRACNFDLCGSCYGQRFGVAVPSAVVPQVLEAAAPPTPVNSTRPVPQAKFVADVTLADGCTVRAGERLVKTWRVRNTGSERWPDGTRIAHVGGDSFGAPMEGVLVPLANAGAIVDVSVAVTMPQQPGRYTSYWRLMTPHPQNSKFGHRFWITCNVLPAEPAPSPVFVRAVPPPPPTVVTQLVGSPAPLARTPAALPVVPSAPRAIEQPADAEDVPVEYVETISRIMDLGFTDINMIVSALRATNGDASGAIERLLE